ncbi:hypothetical protein [Phytoactinopolyspora endophytica]|uniref:hypothetical protein n=1 Tax=Phytoactinopolyspora endophytica TaxID=1642495 RepID=UPI00101D647C|nr:hypothetical protein [Phytoactinopolyspora endophytica]
MAKTTVTARSRPMPEQRSATPVGGSPAWVWMAGGGVCGLAWAAALRAYMAELAGHESTFTWSGTFGAILVPGALAGGLLGWAAYRRRAGHHRGRAWLALAPLTFAIAPMLLPGALVLLVTSGIGSGAIAVAVMGMVGGYALSGRGRRWPRVLGGALGVAFAAALAGTVSGMNPALGLTEPRGAWAGTLVVALFAVLALGCSIPFRVDSSVASSAASEVRS